MNVQILQYKALASQMNEFMFNLKSFLDYVKSCVAGHLWTNYLLVVRVQLSVRWCTQG